MPAQTSHADRPRLYLAGPDVFRPDAVAHGERLKQRCAEAGFVGLYPLDNALPAGLSGPAAAHAIFAANIALIRQADGVIANGNRFRGAEPDSGTAFEIGYAIALGKPVWIHTRERAPLRVQVLGEHAPAAGPAVDADGLTVEDFGLPLNLMLACAATVVTGDFDTCLAQVAKHF